MSLFTELKRRNVLRVGIGYLAGSWLLIQILETLFPIYGLEETSIQIVVAILGIGFIPVLILTWVFEITPEGIKRDEDVDRDVTVSKTFDRVVVIVLALALAFFAYDKFVLDPARDAEIIETATERGRTEALYDSFGDKSIVVLPFVNMSTDADQEYFADGISEELLNLLSRIQELRVISRTSAFSFKGKDIDIATIAEQLNVDHVLEGSVRKSGDKIRITAQLIDARTDSHLWSETYDRTLDDIFVIQDEIAAEVVSQLKITLLADAPTVQRVNSEAYALNMQARHIINRLTLDGPALAKPLLERALELDPEFIPAMVNMGRVYVLSASWGLMSEQEARSRVKGLVARMLIIDPNAPGAYAWLTYMALTWDNDPKTAARYLERLLELAPADVEILRGATRRILGLGRYDEAAAIAEYVVDHDPLCAQCFYNLGYLYRVAGRIEKAEAALRTAISLVGGDHNWHFALGSTLLLKGDAQGALDAFRPNNSEDTQGDAGILMALHDLDRRSEFDKLFSELIANSGENSPAAVAFVYAWTGDADAAFDWLQKSIDSGSLTIWWSQDPLLRSLHDDPRWQPMLASFGRSGEQLAAIPLKITLPPGVTLEGR